MISLIIFAVLVAVLSYVGLVLYRQKVLAPFQVRKLTVPAASITYVTYEGNCRSMMPTVNAIKADLKRFDPNNSYAMIGVYYDNPHNLVDPNRMRAILGVINAPVDFVLAPGNTLQYKTAKHKTLKAFGATFPLIGTLSLMSAILRGYKAIKKYGVANGFFDKETCCATSDDLGYSMEIYEWHKQRLTICFPHGDGTEALFGLSGRPVPAYKHGKYH